MRNLLLGGYPSYIIWLNLQDMLAMHSDKTDWLSWLAVLANLTSCPV
jgi:hypothetical protein